MIKTIKIKNLFKIKSNLIIISFNNKAIINSLIVLHLKTLLIFLDNKTIRIKIISCKIDKTFLNRMITIQNSYSMIHRAYEYGMSEVSMRENIGLLAYSPLAQGVLSGKYLNGNQPEGARGTLFPQFIARYRGQGATQAVIEYQKNIHKIKFGNGMELGSDGGSNSSRKENVPPEVMICIVSDPINRREHLLNNQYSSSDVRTP